MSHWRWVGFPGLLGLLACSASGASDPSAVDAGAGSQVGLDATGGGPGGQGSGVGWAGSGLFADGGSTLNWGVSVHLTDQALPAPPVLGGMAVEVKDSNRSPSALNVSLRWPASARPVAFATEGAKANVLHGCTGPDPIDVHVTTCAPASASVPGCLSLIFDQYGATGTFAHPSGDSCEIHGGRAEIFLRTIVGQDLTSPEFSSSDVIQGRFLLRCTGTGVDVFLDGSFELNVARAILAC